MKDVRNKRGQLNEEKLKENIEKRRQKKQKRRKKSIGSTIVLIICVVIFVVSSYQLLITFEDYKEGNDNFDHIIEEVIQIDLPEDAQGDESFHYSDVFVDFQTLIEENADTVGWIRFDNPDKISYPIMKGETNDTYIRSSFAKEYSNMGSIFVDERNSGTFHDPHTILYGHNMKDGSMFGQLKKYAEEEFYSENPYFYISKPNGKVAKYQIFSARVVSETSDAYTVDFESDEAKQDYINECLRTSYYDTEAPINIEAHLITLSTCTSSDVERFIVQGIEVEEVEMKTP